MYETHAMSVYDGGLRFSTNGKFSMQPEAGGKRGQNRTICLSVAATPSTEFAMARSKPSKQLSQAEIERFLEAAEALHKSIIKPCISPHCDHYRATHHGLV